MSGKLKLLNINAAAELIVKDYDGPKLNDTSKILNTKFNRTKEKEDFVKIVIDTLRNLIQPTNLRCNIDTKMGFFIDVECLFDSKCNPIPYEKSSTIDDATK